MDVAPGRLDDLTTAHVDGGVVDARTVGLAGPPEDEVTRLQVDERNRGTRRSCTGRRRLARSEVSAPFSQEASASPEQS